MRADFLGFFPFPSVLARVLDIHSKCFIPLPHSHHFIAVNFFTFKIVNQDFSLYAMDLKK
ncbi:Putative hypothetical protein [Helicobacter mustelae 12198]|uniref:Uncharacterized protein n=1 Tax=Helicobacter mustelae (strain ATCC 43772 / CCUG 25715 / CIP 103759 / LMG 18044 / NCTC 12198 / R85-136P) TaxID=679897 RepID=D3UH17_HELM1|nr:Putative hypothetical protein [Helicobacter mustelae 12198]